MRIRPLFFVSMLFAFGLQLAYGEVVREVHHPESEDRSIAGVSRFDFGKDAFGWLELRVPENANGDYEIRLGERLKRDGSLDPQPGGSVRFASVAGQVERSGWMRIPLLADMRNTRGANELAAEQVVTLPDEIGVVMPFRYVEITKAPFKVTKDDVRRVWLHWDVDRLASFFVSSLPLLDRVYDFCKYSIEATSFAGVYVDGDRERIPYEADAYINQLGHYAMDCDFEMARWTYRRLLEHPTWPTEWKQHMIMIAWTDWMWSGSLSLVAASYEILKNDKLLLSLAREDGLIVSGGTRHSKSATGNDIVDWPVCERDEFDARPVNAVVNAFHYRNLIQMSEMAFALGRKVDGVFFRERAHRVKASYNRVFFDSRTSLYVDGEGSSHSSLHANAAALAVDLVPKELIGGVADVLERKGMACSVYFAQYLLEALFKADRADAAIRLMASEGERSWIGMMKQGSTITMEAWNSTVKPNQDWNHAWGTVPLNIIARYVLGVTPATPGFGNVRVRPQTGSMSKVSGSVPIPGGQVKVNVDNGHLTVDSPRPVLDEWTGMCCDKVGLKVDEAPLFTAGFMSDTHLDPSTDSCVRVRAAYEFFKATGVSLIANLGDIADRHYPEAYRAYRQVRETVYPDAASRPKEVFLWAHHDRTHFRGQENGDYTEAFEAAKPILGIEHDQIDRFEMGGYTFLIFPQWIDKRLDIYEKNIAGACAANPGKPVFVLNHVPPADTTEGTRGSRDLERRILDRHPQVVVFSGHTHGTLRDERLIWQKGFVNVNLGCLSRWSGNFLGRVPPPVQVWTVAYLEFYRDRLVVRRFSLKDGSEIGADEPWTIRWGVDDGRYAPELRAKGAPEPNFPAGAVPTVTADGDPMRSVNVTWPAGEPDRGVLGYRLRIETRRDGGWQTLAVRETCSDFWRETDERAARMFTDCLPAAFFDEGARYRFSIEPYGFYGKVGARIFAEWTAPRKDAADPLCVLDSDLPVLHGGEKFLLPQCVQDLPPQTPLRAIVDAESEHGADEGLSFRIQGYPVKEVVSGWAHTEPGKVFRRYVIDFRRGSGKQLIYLAAPFSKPHLTLKLMRVRIERK